MATYFISDLHLDEKWPDIADNFLRFMQTMAPQADALYVLGDLFETWIGDDIHSEFTDKIIAAFAALHQQGVPIYFMHGNRDFLIGKKFAKQTGCILLPDPTIAELYGKPVLLMHGDSLCTDDVKYLKIRNFAYKPSTKRMFLLLPKFIRRRIAQHLRNKSKQHATQVTSSIQDVTQHAVEDIMTQYHVDTLIHGHTHKPAIHEFELNGKPAKRVVLAAWHDGGQVLRYDENHQISVIDL